MSLRFDEEAVVQEEYVPEESGYFDSLFALANGYVGIRPVLDPESEHAVAGCFFADLYAPGLATRREIVKAPSWHTLRVRDAEGEAISFDETPPAAFERRLDLETAVLETRVEVALAPDRRLALDWRLCLPADEKHCGWLEGTATPRGWSGEAELESWLDLRSGNAYMGGLVPEIETCHPAFEEAGELAEGGLFLVVRIAGSDDRLAFASAFTSSRAAGRVRLVRRRRQVGQVLPLRVEADRPSPFVKLVSFFHSRDTADPLAAAVRLLAERRALAPERVRDEHRRIWSASWRNVETRIEGAPEDRAPLRFGQLHLHGAVDAGRESQNVPARGLTSEYHSGHGFFNSELYKLPYWLYTDPGRARALLGFRAATLDAGRRHAADTGFAGARYPEEVDDRGEPASPWEIREIYRDEVYHEWSGRETRFLSAAVAAAVDWYWHTTGDDGFMTAHGVEMLVETARFGRSLLDWPEGAPSFGIRSVMGPDEYHYHVDDNLFTNHVVAHNLRRAATAVQWLRRRHPDLALRLTERLALEESEVADWERAAAARPEPRRFAGGVLEQFHGYRDLPDQLAGEADAAGRPRLDGETADAARRLESFSTRLIKEADVVLLHALFPEAFDDEQKRLDLDYYLPRTTLESSLAASPYGVVAALVGRPREAVRMYRLAVRFNLDFQPRGGYRNGIHLAGYAGGWQVLAQGFLGLRPSDPGLVLRPRPLPSEWRGLRLRLVHRGVPLRVELAPGRMAITPEAALDVAWEAEGEAGAARLEAGRERVVLLPEPPE